MMAQKYPGTTLPFVGQSRGIVTSMIFTSPLFYSGKGRR